MRNIRVDVVAACAAVLALWGCGKEQPAPAAPDKAPANAAQKAAELVAPYTYPAPVKGHYKEINTGDFDVVDGIAYTASGGAGTVIYVTDKQIASPMIAESSCPMTQARALSKLRNVKYLEVTLVNGVSKYFAAGTAFDGSSSEQEAGGHYWSSKMNADPNRAVGSVVYKGVGTFEFDMPLSKPKVDEESEGGPSEKRGVAAPEPTEQAVTAAYQSLHDAALKKNLRALLAALGFDAKQVTAIQGLDGIDADLMVYSDRFLTPGVAGEFHALPGTGTVRAEGANSRGKRFVNYYHFAACGDHLVLAGIGENPM